MTGTFSPPPWVSDLDMHHGTCVRTRRNACRDRLPAVSFEVGGGKNVPIIPAACATRNFCVSGKRPKDEFRTNATDSMYIRCVFANTYSKGTSGSQINSNRTDLPLYTQPCASYINTKFHKHQALAINSTYLKGYHLVLHTQHEMKLFHMTADINYFKENIQNFEGDLSHLDAHPKFGVPKMCLYVIFVITLC